MPGDLVIIVAYAQMSEMQARTFTPRVVLVDERNRAQPAPAIAPAQ